MDEEIIEAMIPDDLPLPEAGRAETSFRMRPGVKLVTQENFEERMGALLDLMRVSMEPAIALMPTSKRKEISAAFESFEALVKQEEK